MLAIDFETHLISNEHPYPKPICLSWADSNDKGLIVGLKDIEEFLKKILVNEDIIAHNMSFEYNVINVWFPKLEELLDKALESDRLKCTKVNEQLISKIEEKGLSNFALDSLVKKYFKEDISEDKKNPNAWRLRYHELEGVPIEKWPIEAKEYALNDSLWALKCYKKQNISVIKPHLTVKTDCYLNLMASTGMRINKERVFILKEELSKALTPKYKALEAAGFCTWDDKKKRFKKNMKIFRLYVEKVVPNPEFTAKGVVSTGKESITRYIAQELKESTAKNIFLEYLGVLKYEKIMTAYVAKLETADPLIRTTYNACISTGRTSSSGSKIYPSVNIQQMPRSVEGVTWDIRNCFVPRSGYYIVSIDYSGLELASTAHNLYKLTGLSNMRDIINRGDTPTDIHSIFAARIMSLKERYKVDYEHFKAHKKEKPYCEYRQLAKPINLGFPGGIGYDSMRTLLAKENIFPKLKTLESAKYESSLTWKRSKLRKEGHPVRIRQVAYDKYELVYDELVELKQELFALYPDLEHFLSEGHKEYLNGKSKMIKNEFGIWEKEPLYNFDLGSFSKYNCMYTQVCNGLLMQCPTAIGAKKAMCKIISKYKNSNEVKPLAFIHDEIVFEVQQNSDYCAILKDISEIMIDEMQSVLTSVRVAVEAEVFEYWKKAGGFYEVSYWKDAGNKKLKGE